MKLLNNIDLWQAASDQQRFDEIRRIEKHVADFGLSFIGIEQFTVNALSFEIPMFYHGKLQMQFNLLPGHLAYKVGAAPEHLPFLSQRRMMVMNEFYFEQKYPIEIKPFFISDYLIKQGAWKEFGQLTISDTISLTDDHPIDAVDREDIVPWAAQFGLRLPSDMEWEYACKAGSSTLYYWGDEPNDEYAWVETNWPFSFKEYHSFTKEEQKLPNAFGLYGMLGNLDEWVADDEYEYQEQIVSQNPFVAFKGESKYHNGILRGGSYLHDWRHTRSTYRAQCAAADIGISARLAISLFDIINVKS